MAASYGALTSKLMFPRWTLTLLASLALTACGGGGSGDSSSATPPGTETPSQPGTPGVTPPEVAPPEVDPPAVLPPVTEPPS